MVLALVTAPTRAPGAAPPRPGVPSLGHAQLVSSSFSTDPASDIETVAGNGTAGYSGDNHEALAAELDSPRGDAIDANGDLAIADFDNNVVRLVAGTSGEALGIPVVAGDIYTVAGNGIGGYSGDNGSATSAELHNPAVVAFDALGNLVISDWRNNVLRLVSAITCSSGCPYGLSSMTPGDIYTVAGNGTQGFLGDTGAATSAELYGPTGLATDHAGNVVFADSGNYRIRVVAESTGTYYGVSMTAGDIYTVAGNGTDGNSGDGGPGTSAELAVVDGVAIDPAGNAVFSDQYNNIVQVVAGSACSSGCPYGLSSITAGYVYLVAGTGTAGYTGDGAAATAAELDFQALVAIDSAGNVVIADLDNRVVRVVAAQTGTSYGVPMTAGDIYTIAGDGSFGGSGDGSPAGAAELEDPEGVATNDLGEVFVVDYGSESVRAFGGGPAAVEGVVPQGAALGADQNGGGGGPQAGCPCSVVKPVNVASGDYYDSVTDLSIPGAGVPLRFTRTYDANAAQAEEAGASTSPPLGYGWASNLGMSVSYNSTSGVATVTEADGALITFQHYAMGASGEAAWCPSDASSAVYCPTAPRYVATLSLSGGIYTYVDELHAPLTYTFSSSGTLSQIADAAGDTLGAASYVPGTGQPACPSGDTCTAWTSSASLQSLVVETATSSGQLLSVFDPAATAQTVSFAYTGSGCSTWGSGQPLDLCSATVPGSLTTTYTYDTGKSSPYQYDEVTMTPPATGEVTNTFDSSGRVSEQTLTTGSGTTQVTDFSYSSVSGLSGGSATTVTSYPLGTGSGKPTDVTRYEFSNEVLVATTTGYGTSSAATTFYRRDPATLLATATVDPDGNVATTTLADYAAPGGSAASSADATSEQDGAHATVHHAYTAANLPWCMVGAAEYADGVRCPSSAPTTPPTSGDGATLTIYNTADEPTSVTDPLGNTTIDKYTSGVSGVPNGLRYCGIDPVQYATGTVTCAAYGSHNAGTTTTTYDSAGDVTASTDPNGDATSYSYGVSGHPGLVSSQTDPNGTTTTYSYNAAGEVTAQVVTSGGTGGYTATTQYAYDSAGRRFCEVVPFEYALGKTCPSSPPSSPPTPSSDPDLGMTITSFDSAGRVVQTTNPLGGITYTAYDAAGEPWCSVSAYESANPRDVSCLSSPPSSPPTLSSDPDVGATITTYDAAGRPVQVTNPLGGITLTSYDAAGNVSGTTVESGQTGDPNVVSAFTFDGDNRVATTTLGSGASSATTSVSYDPDGNAYCSVSADDDALGAYSSSNTGGYQCPAWQAGWVVAPPSPASLYSSTPSAAQADKVTTTFHDADGNELQRTDPDGQTTVTAVDGDGRAYCSADPTNVSTYLTAHPSATYPYLCPTTPPTSAPSSATGYVTTIYDAAGRTTSSTDALADTTAYTYAPGGQVLTTTDPRAKVTTDCYYYEDGSGQCAHGATQANGSFDDLYSTLTPATSADPSGETTTDTYFAGGLADTTTTPAGTTTDGYDALGDATSVTYSGTASGYSAPANVTATFNVDGSKATVADGTGTTTYSYDAAGDLTAQALTAGSGSGLAATTYSYSYFKTGVLDTVVYPTYGSYSSPTATYAYDANGNMASVTDWAGNEVTFAHDANGNETNQDNAVSTSYPNGTSGTTFAFDPAGQPTGAQSALSCPSSSATTLTQVVSASYAPPSGTTTAAGTSNPDGQVTQDEEVYANSSGTTSCAGLTSYERNYSYDEAGRVVYQGTSAGGSSNFSYDASGDPTGISSHDSSASFDTYTQSFDSAGEVTGQTPISGSGGVSSTDTYDSIGALSSTTAGSATTNDSSDQLGEMTGVSTGPLSGQSASYMASGLESAVSGWAPRTNVDGTHTIFSISCPTTTFCAAGDDAGDVLTWNGTAWSAASNVDGTHTVEGMSCPSASFCAAVDNAGNLITWSGTSWSSATSIDGTTAMWSVSCSSSSACTAVDNSGNVLFTTNGWSTHTKTNEDSHMFDRLSCPSSTFCTAVDNHGNAVSTTNDWASGSVTTTAIDGTTHLGSVSCTSASFCVAVDNSGNAITTSNGWSTHSSSDVDGSSLLESVTCLSTTDCIAADVNGDIVSYDGTSWSTPLAVDPTTLRGPSCASTTFCVAVDHQGNVVGFDGVGVSQLTWSPVVASLPSVVSDGTWDYLYGPAGEPVEQVNVTASPPSANPRFLTYFPSDSSWLVTSTTGSDLAFYRYDAYGTLALGTPSSSFGYGGQYGGLSANANGLENLRARWYSPQVGTFTSRDPGFAATDQAYAYAGGDPVNEGDPCGLRGGAGAAAGAAADEACGYDGSKAFSVSCLLFQFHEDAEIAALPSDWNSFVEHFDPVYQAMIGAYNAYELAQNPCSSDWEIAEQADLAFIGADSTALTALGGAGIAGSVAGQASSAFAQSWLSDAASNLTPKTIGLLKLPDGLPDLLLISGRNGPAEALRGLGFMNNVLIDHVEAQAVAVMRAEGVSSATLLISKVPCSGCEGQLARWLPQGSSLTVEGPNGYVNTFYGTRQS